MNWPWSKTFKHKCPDGTIRIIHKNIDDAFPLALKEVQSKFNADIKAQEQASARLKTEYATKISGLLYSINDFNQSLMITFRSAYAAFQASPCSNNEFLLRQTETVIQEQHRLMELKTQIHGLISMAESFPNHPERILSVYHEIVGKLGGVAIAESAKEAIKENRANAMKWIEGGNNG